MNQKAACQLLRFRLQARCALKTVRRNLPKPGIVPFVNPSLIQVSKKGGQS